jgi:uncharacterized protein
MSRNCEIVRTFYEAFARGDVPAGFAVFHPEIEFHEAPSLPWGKVYRGIAGMQEFLGALVQWFGNDIKIDAHFYADAPDDQVVVHANFRVLDRSFPFLELWKIADGKAKRIEPFLDTAGLMARLREVGRL